MSEKLSVSKGNLAAATLVVMLASCVESNKLLQEETGPKEQVQVDDLHPSADELLTNSAAESNLQVGSPLFVSPEEAKKVDIDSSLLTGVDVIRIGFENSPGVKVTLPIQSDQEMGRNEIPLLVLEVAEQEDGSLVPILSEITITEPDEVITNIFSVYPLEQTSGDALVAAQPVYGLGDINGKPHILYIAYVDTTGPHELVFFDVLARNKAPEGSEGYS